MESWRMESSRASSSSADAAIESWCACSFSLDAEDEQLPANGATSIMTNGTMTKRFMTFKVTLRSQ